MKNLSRLFLATLLLLSFNSIEAQNENNPWLVSFGVNAVDLYPVGEDVPQGDMFDEFFNAKDHYNILPSLSTLTVSRYIDKGFSLGVTGSVNKIDKFGDAGVDDLSYYALDGTVKYGFAELLKSKIVDPYLGVGGGYTWVDEIGAGTFNGTLGFNFWLTESIAFNLQSSYKHAFEDYLSTHFQHSAGVAINFGGKDTDGDGIYDQDDACVDVPGLEAFNGCPDTDNDGIEDSKDNCPQQAGLAEFNGCPDSDGDGVADNSDNCPTVAGLKSLAGCPDADADGVTDADDNCPDEAGPVANNGCPYTDKDNDGVLDKDDNCPDTPGVASNAGCPEPPKAPVVPTQETMNKLNTYAKTILFDSSKASFKQETYPVLQAITAILKEYPESNFTIEGHTDSVGSKANNQKLSEKRANAVKDYLVQNGVSAARLTASGFGEDSPIDSNATAAGRKNNRRVEVKLRK